MLLKAYTRAANDNRSYGNFLFIVRSQKTLQRKSMSLSDWETEAQGRDGTCLRSPSRARNRTMVVSAH